MSVNKLIIPLLFLLTGFVSAYIIFSPTEVHNTSKHPADVLPADTDKPSLASQMMNPFSTNNNHADDTQRLEILEKEISQIKQQLEDISLTLQQQSDQTAAQSTTGFNAQRRPAASSMRFTSTLNQRMYSLDNLLKGGIDQTLAEDIVRRKNSIELKKLQLQDRAKRENYFNTQRYFNELEALEKNNINLRDELGDERYDEYLFDSKQNNRIRINSVMLGSAAEQAGILEGDIVLSYDNTRLYSWPELKNATTEGNLGEYVLISILRNGQIFSYSVPRGPLGIQLGATRIQP